MDLQETYNKIANDWHHDHLTDDWWIEGTDKFISFLKKGDLVLDVGCAGGVKSKYLIEKGMRVTGIDFSKDFIEIAEREVPEGKFIEMDMYDIQDLPVLYDGIFAQASLLHIPKKDALVVLVGLVQKLKESGFLYVAVKESILGKPQEEVKSENDYGYSYERFFSYFSMDELVSLYNDVGLRVVYQENKKMNKTNWLELVGQKIN